MKNWQHSSLATSFQQAGAMPCWIQCEPKCVRLKQTSNHLHLMSFVLKLELMHFCGESISSLEPTICIYATVTKSLAMSAVKLKSAWHEPFAVMLNRHRWIGTITNRMLQTQRLGMRFVCSPFSINVSWMHVNVSEWSGGNSATSVFNNKFESIRFHHS